MCIQVGRYEAFWTKLNSMQVQKGGKKYILYDRRWKQHVPRVVDDGIPGAFLNNNNIIVIRFPSF